MEGAAHHARALDEIRLERTDDPVSFEEGSRCLERIETRDRDLWMRVLESDLYCQFPMYAYRTPLGTVKVAPGTLALFCEAEELCRRIRASSEGPPRIIAKDDGRLFKVLSELAADDEYEFVLEVQARRERGVRMYVEKMCTAQSQAKLQWSLY